MAVDQAIETIRNRIDQFGVSEPVIQRQGEDMILVQLPGVKDPQRAINLIGKTATLEFKLVDDENSLEKALKGDLPADGQLLYQRQVNPSTGVVSQNPFLLNSRTLLTGDSLTSAQVRIDSRFNEPYVSIEFDTRGAQIFERITRNNVNKRLAIVLDGNVYSAPQIQERIAGGQAQITGSFSMEEARDLAIVLRAGSLPAPVTIVEKSAGRPLAGPRFDCKWHTRDAAWRRTRGHFYVRVLQACRHSGLSGRDAQYRLAHGDAGRVQGHADPARHCRHSTYDRHGR